MLDFVVGFSAKLAVAGYFLNHRALQRIETGWTGYPFRQTTSPKRLRSRMACCAAFAFEALVIKIVLRLASYLPQRLIHKSPRTLARKIWIVTANFSMQLRFFQILSRPGFEEFFKRFPSVAYKHTEPDDLARSLTTAQRASCHLHHYSFLRSHLCPASLRQLLNREVRVFEATDQGHTFAIDLAAALPGYYEGELRLNFLADGIDIFILSFTFVPGSQVGSTARDAILISRIQGEKGAQSIIAMATRTLLGVHPQALLVSAIEGIAETLGIAEVVCVSAANQPTDSTEMHATFAQRYDEFFESWDASFSSPGFYTLPVSFPQKPLREIKLSHRPRTKKRRALKRLVADQAALALLPALLPSASPSPAEKNPLPKPASISNPEACLSNPPVSNPTTSHPPVSHPTVSHIG